MDNSNKRYHKNVFDGKSLTHYAMKLIRELIIVEYSSLAVRNPFASELNKIRTG